MPLGFADELTREVIGSFVLHEMDQGNRITGVHSGLRGLRVFICVCAKLEYLQSFQYALLKVN